MKRQEQAAPALNDLEHEVVHLLTDLGLDHKMAKVITFLARVDEGKSADIERACELRQPEVSVATKGLRELGWVATEERKRGGKGRPVHFYRLHVPLPKIIEVIEADKRREMQDEIAKIERLKGLFA